MPARFLSIHSASAPFPYLSASFPSASAPFPSASRPFPCLSRLLLALFLFIFLYPASAQPGTGYDRSYHPLHSGNTVGDKNFYWLTVVNQTPAVRKLLSGEEHLRALHDRLVAALKSHATDTCIWASSMVTGFRFTPADAEEVSDALETLYHNNKGLFDEMIDKHLRPSGFYQRFTALPNDSLLAHAWGQTVAGINYIIDQYGLGKKMRYPRIDSASYDVNGRYYRAALKTLFTTLSEKADDMNTFYQPSLTIALQLMDINDRDEPARFEPLETGENKAALQAVKITDWSKYTYATIVVPGEGPEITTVPLDPMGKMRCDLAASRYQKGLAPFIILSGGYCHPFHTPYAEAYEMKKYLVARYAIPEKAIIIEPQARHTTTNLRNADRLMIHYGIPITKPSDIVSTKFQIDYIVLPQQRFDERNMHELGYLPYRDKKQVSMHDVSFYPVMESLQMDPLDPLDP